MMGLSTNQVFAKNVRLLRVQRGWSQEEFAERSGLHRTYVGAIERGQRNITLKTLDLIANAFNVPPATLPDGSVHG